jgi:hypothetical protein
MVNGDMVNGEMIHKPFSVIVFYYDLAGIIGSSLPFTIHLLYLRFTIDD